MSYLVQLFFFAIKKKILFVYFSREKGKEGETEGEKQMDCLSHTPNWGPGLQLRHVP